ncbi:MAG: DUF4157 domain-containing protein [Gilvibacter sp.]
MRRIERKKKSNPVNSAKKAPFFKKVQPKVSIGQPNDHYEKEADAMADAVTKGSGTHAPIKQKTSQQNETQSKPLASQITPLVQRAPEEETQAKVQRMEEEEAQTKVQRQEEEEAAQTKVQRMEEEEAQTKVQRQEEEAQTKVQRMEEEEAQTKVQRQEEEEAAQTKVQRQEEEEAAQPKVQLMEEEEAQTKVQRMEEEEAQTKVQRMEEEEAQTKVQPKASKQSTVKPTMEATLRSKKGSGAKMDSNTKSEMETGFGADFSGVNIHTDSKAQEMSQEIGAQAFTHGNDVYFNQGKYNPQSQEGKHLLAHELTHTIQQKGANKLQKQDKPPTTAPPTATPATPAAKKSTLLTDSLAKLKTFSALCYSYMSKAAINGGLTTIKKETYAGVDVLFKLNLKTVTGGGSVLALFTPGKATQNTSAKPPNVTVPMEIDLDASILTSASTPALVEKFARDMYHESLHMVIFIDSQRSDLTGSTTLDSSQSSVNSSLTHV